MKRYAKLTLIVAAVVLLGTYEASARGPRGHGGGPAGRGPAVRGPAVRGPAVRGPAVRGPAVRYHVNNPTVRARGYQVRRPLGVPYGAGTLAARRGAWNRHAAMVRGNLRGRYNYVFTPGWYARHPNAWRPRHYHPGFWTAVVAWPVLANWVGIGAAYPYDYGTVYENNYYLTEDDMPVDETSETAIGEEYPIADEFPEEAAALAAQGYSENPNDTTTGQSDQWLPLGVYTITAPGTTTTPHRVFQFAVNKDGVIRGTYYDALSDQAVPVQGAINKKTQRAAWTVGSNKQTVMETNLGSFVEQEAAVLVHPSKGQTEEWIMVRLEKPTTGQTNQPGTKDQPQNQPQTAPTGTD